MKHPGRKVFVDYAVQRAIEGKEQEIRELLLGGFQEHDDDPPLPCEPFQCLRNKLLKLVKSKYIEEIITNMSHSVFHEME